MRDGKGKPIIRPFCQSSGVSCRRYSIPLQRIITDFGADVPFGRIPQKLLEHYGITVPISSAQKITLLHAATILQPTFSSPTDEIQKKSPKNRNLILKKKVNLINGRLVRVLCTLTNCYKVSNSQESMINENYHPNQINLPSVAQ